MTKAKTGATARNTTHLAKKQKIDRKQKKNSPPLLLSTDRDHVDYLLDEALQATFPASDPVSIGNDPIQDRSSRITPAKRN